ncbi:class I SAM-dependent methyltransferase [Mariniblastus sp.]|nr:class I SAM-dependent methyltransferase [Mariniblastus sp.]
MKPSDARQHNRAAWNRLAEQQNRLARPAREQDFANPLAAIDARGWLGPDITGKSVLCLAAGGGRQGPIYAAAGAIVTVVDISPTMLDLDRQVAKERGMNIRTIETSMDDLSMLGDATFDIVTQPVSTCYISDVGPVYREVARVLRVGGLYISQHKQPISLQTSIKPTPDGYTLKHSAYRSDPLPATATANLVREPGTIEYIHRYEMLLGQMCRSSLVIEDVTEPLHADPVAEAGTFEHRSQFAPPYIRIKARRIETEAGTANPRSPIVLA